MAEKRDNLIAFQLDEGLREKLNAEAARSGLTVSAIIRLRLEASYGMSEGIVVPPRKMRFTGSGGTFNVIVGGPMPKSTGKRVKAKAGT